MSYLAILGRQPELGIVELESVLGSESVERYGSHALIKQAYPLSQLGGCIKLARVIQQVPLASLQGLEWPLEQLPQGDSKTPFGASFYGFKLSPAKAQALGLQLKKQLGPTHGSLRLIMPAPGATALGAAQLTHNHVLTKGFELVVATEGATTILALTTQVQDIAAYSARDYLKPVREAKIGMLPPKLAQILVNTAGQNSPIWDPFCGSGTILQEALLMGREAWGSDINPEMIAASRANLEKLKGEHPPLPHYELSVADARQAHLPHPQVQVASEGYLGAPGPSASQVEAQRSEITSLYHDFLTNLQAQLPTGAHVSLCAPAWGSRGIQRLDIIDRLPDLGYTLKRFKGADSRRLIYQRPGQVVARQLLLIRKN